MQRSKRHIHFNILNIFSVGHIFLSCIISDPIPGALKTYFRVILESLMRSNWPKPETSQSGPEKFDS